MPSKWIKTLLLLFLLGMPVALYLFLQGFGENKYTVPVYYEDGISDPNTACTDHQRPHLVDRFLKESPSLSRNDYDIQENLVVFCFVKMDCSDRQLEELARVSNQFREESKFHAVTVSMDIDASEQQHQVSKGLYGLTSEVWSWWGFHNTVPALIQCGFNLALDCTTAEQLVLMDSKFQIRGYYRATDFQEIDRLVTEIQLLLMEMETDTDG